MKNRFLAILISGFFSFPLFVFSQSATEQSELEAYRPEVEKLISFVEYIFNALGSEDLSVQDKDVVVNDSFLKAFRDGKVQIEDDLISGRQVVTNKDVQAYLKDIDFFFNGARFKLQIEDIKEGVNEDGNLFFRVKLSRSLKAETIDGDSINNVIPRYVEINLNKKSKDLRIASIYTTKIAEKEELINWWTSLSPAWKKILGEKVVAYDNFSLSEVTFLEDATYGIGGMVFQDKDLDIAKAIKKAASQQSLDLSNRKEIVDVEALYEMTDLKVLNISNTSVSSLFPLRNLNSLEKLYCSNTSVESLDPIIYCAKLKELDISNTHVTDLEPLRNLKNLEVLSANNLVADPSGAIRNLTALTSVSLEYNVALPSLDFVARLGNLVYLNVNGTAVSDLSAASALVNLKTLDISQSKVSSLKSLSSLASLEKVNMENTKVSSLEPLAGTPVKLIFCEGSAVSRDEVISFLKTKPGCEVIFQTKDLEVWWRAVPESWKKMVFGSVKFEGSPTPEILHRLIRIDTVNISGHTEIDNLKPLEKLLMLRKLDCSNTSVASLSPLENQTSLEEINFSNTKVADIAPLKNMTKLRVVKGSHTDVAHINVFENFSQLEKLYFDYTNVKNVEVINSLPAFKVGYFDSTQVSDDDAMKLTFAGDDKVVVYKSGRLWSWWGGLTDEWQDMFRKAMNFSKRPSREEIHKLTSLTQFTVKSILVNDISPMIEFTRLKELRFNDTQISNISSLAKLSNLEVLDCSRNPIESLEPLSNLLSLRVLYVENTQIDEIDPVARLVLLEELKFSNTEVKDLGPLEKLVNLKVLEFSNTKAKNIKPIMDLPLLKQLKCYNNSGLSAKRVDEFKQTHPNCEVVYY